MTLFALALGSAATASCVLYMQVGNISVIDSLVTPAYAKKEVVYKEHKDVFNKIEAIIKVSATFDVAKRKVEAATWPDKVMHVALSKVVEAQAEGVEADTCYVKTPWTNMRTVIRNGSGYGSIITQEGEMDIVVLDNEIKSLGRDKIHYTVSIKSAQQMKRG